MTRRTASDRLRVAARVGRFRLEIDARVTPDGLKAAGAVVSSILLSTAVLVASARRRALPTLPPPRG